MKTPCFNCQSRSIGCHARCDAYQEWSAERQSRLRTLKESKAIEEVRINGIVKRSIWRMKNDRR